MKELLETIRQCTLCEAHLPLGPRPILSAETNSKILLVSQAPGTKAHASGIPWNDPGGRTLRKWMGVDAPLFYDPKIFGIMPMGFCYPGRGKGGDLPPMPECAPKWHLELWNEMKEIKLVLLIGQYAQNYYLGRNKKKNLTETVRNYKNYLPKFFPLVHPSPRNRMWHRRNPWFEEEVIPALQNEIHALL